MSKQRQKNSKIRNTEAVGIVLKLSLLLERKRIRMRKVEREFVTSLDLGRINTEELTLLKKLQEKYT